MICKLQLSFSLVHTKILKAHLQLYLIVGGIMYSEILLKIIIHLLLATYNEEHGVKGYGELSKI